MTRQHAKVWGATVGAAAMLLAACGGDDDGGADPDDTGSGTTAAPREEPALRILVANDDGVEGEGVAALVDELEQLEGVEITVVVPVENQSGTSDTTSSSPPTATETTLVGGHEAIAVAGFPADSVLHALDEVLDEEPHLVVSGVNLGQNLGPVVHLSGTVGAARTAARRGIPALAVSQGLGEPVDFETGARLAVDWVEEHRATLLAGEVGTDTIANLNVPSCTTGEVRGTLEVEAAADAAGRDFLAPSDCTSTLADPADDIDAFLNGYATLSDVPVEMPA